MIKFVAILLSLAIVGCSSTTTITSTDRDAKIYIDGELKGRGTVTHTDKKIVGSTTRVKLKKEGCREQHFTIDKSEEFNAGACAGGVFVLVPFLWVMGYKPTHNYEYECDPIK